MTKAETIILAAKVLHQAQIDAKGVPPQYRDELEKRLASGNGSQRIAFIANHLKVDGEGNVTVEGQP